MKLRSGTRPCLWEPSAAIVRIVLCCLLVGCGSRTVLPTGPSAPARMHTPAPENTYFVDVWVDNATPARDEKVILIGMLNRNGVFLSGIAMQATWPDAENPRGRPNCSVQLSYGRGVCVIDAAKYPPGRYVPIQVMFAYDGGVYVGETGFTPR